MQFQLHTCPHNPTLIVLISVRSQYCNRCMQRPAVLYVLQTMTSSALAEFDPWQWQRQHITLPEITLAGPVELVFSRITDLSLFLPHSIDVPSGKRLLIHPGAAITLRQLKGISLRKPVDLPKLPRSYMTEVYAHLKLGEAEPGFENAPGMLFLASELYRQATNASLGLSKAGGRTRQLLSFEIEPAGESLMIQTLRLSSCCMQLRGVHTSEVCTEVRHFFLFQLKSAYSDMLCSSCQAWCAASAVPSCCSLQQHV